MAEPAPEHRPALPVARNAVWLAAGEVASKVASLVFVVIVARALGVREYGWFTFANAFVPLLAALGSLGLHQAVVRATVRDPASGPGVFASGLVVRLLTSVLALVVATATAPLFLPDRGAVLTVAVVGAALLLDAVTIYTSAVFEAHGSVRPYTVALVLNRFVSTGLAAAAYAAGGGLPLVLAAYLAGSAAGVVSVWRRVRRDFPEYRVRRASRRGCVTIVKQGASLTLGAVLNMALLRADTLLVAPILGATAVGLYGVAFRFYESFLFLAFALGDAAFPRLTQLGRGAEAARAVERITAVAACAYVPLFVLSAVAARDVVVLVFGERYAEAAEAVPWLTAAAVLFAVTYQARSGLIALGGALPVAGVAAVALVVSVTVNLVLLPRIGIEGAGVAAASAAAVEAVLTALALRRRGLAVRFPRVVGPAVLAGAATCGVVAATGSSGLAAAAVGAVAYPALLLPLLRLLPSDVRDAVPLPWRR